ncbi:MAG: peptidylprolyl isomerase [Candidatus Eisenbacteria bacterium]
MRRIALVLVMIMFVAVGCAEKKEAEPVKTVQPVPPGNIRASHILVSYAGVERTTATRTKEEADALIKDLKKKLDAGESFEELATTYSDCPSAENQGDLGFFRKGQMVKPFENAAFALEPGKVSDIVETKFGYHIIKRTQ